MQELFKPVLRFEGKYEVSNFGRIKSLNYGMRGKEQFRKVQTNKLGYQYISLWKDGKPNMRTVHSVVWEAFNGPVLEGYEINHMDENPSNNRLDNLNLLTHKQNMNWATVRERMSRSRKGRKQSKETKDKISKSQIGKLVNHPGISKRVAQYTLDGEYVNDYPGTQEAVRQNPGFSGGCIRECCNGGRRKAHKGYKWKYIIIN